MDKPEQQDGVWGGEGPQSSGASPTVTCEFEAQPERCMFPECPCASVPLVIADDGDIPPFLQRNKPTTGKIAAIADDIAATAMKLNDVLGGNAEPLVLKPRSPGLSTMMAAAINETRKPKRDRAAYMRDYRARTSAARTQ